MSAAIGYISAGANLGAQSIKIKPRRRLGEFTAQVTLKERHRDDLEITQHPVQQGASISDHAYVKPAELVVECAWSNSPSYQSLAGGLLGAAAATAEGIQSILTGNSASQVKDVYQKLLKLQSSLVPFDVYTGKRKYSNMLIRSLVTETDAETENILLITVHMQQIIIVSTQTVMVENRAEVQADPGATTSTSNQGAKSLVPAPNYIPQ